MKKIFILLAMCIAFKTYAQDFGCKIPSLPPSSSPVITPSSSMRLMDGSGPYIIPVVIHILHMGGEENIADAQAHSIIQALNEDFNKDNPDIGDVIPEFAAVVADVGIEFRLAKKDPFGNPTSGITRTYSPLTLEGYDYTTSMLNPWPRNKYLNIWIVKSMGVAHDPYVAAFAFYPASVHYYPDYDGVVARYNYAGFVGAASEATRHVITHEVGHYLSLQHTWGDDTLDALGCGDDGIHDTPITGSSDCNLSRNVCVPGIIENVQNFMTGTYCFRMFTEGQKDVMIEVLESTVSQRNELWQLDNLISTGVVDEMSIPNVDQNAIQIFPNPTDNMLHIMGMKASYKVVITNTVGQNIYTQSFEAGTNAAINLSAYPNGTYYIQIKNATSNQILKSHTITKI